MFSDILKTAGRVFAIGLVLSSTNGFGAANISPEAQALADAKLAACDSGKGSFSDGAITEADVTGDGETDLIVDEGLIVCSDKGRSPACGVRTCPISIYVRQNGKLVFTLENISIGVGIGPGNPPAILLMSHDFSEGYERWDGKTFVYADGKPADPGPASPGSPPVIAATWSYGKHPVLGLSAHADLASGEAIGLACAYEGRSLAQTGIVALRVTPGLVDGNQMTLMFDPDGGAGTLTMTPRSGYSEYVGDTCMTNVDDFQHAAAAVLPHGHIGSVGDKDGKTVFGFERDGKQYEIGGVADLTPFDDVRRISLKGSSKAIAQLVGACWAMRQDIEDECGVSGE